MKKLFFALIFAALPVLSFAAEHGGPELEKVDIDVSDKAALQDGARTFANYCMPRLPDRPSMRLSGRVLSWLRRGARR